MPRLKMVWLPMRKWISFIPVAFIIYILLQYLVYQPELRVASLERSAYVGEAKLLNLTSSLQNVEDPQAISNVSVNRSNSRYLQSGSLDSLGHREIFRHLQDAANQQPIAVSKNLGDKPEIMSLHIEQPSHIYPSGLDRQTIDHIYTPENTGHHFVPVIPSDSKDNQSHFLITPGEQLDPVSDNKLSETIVSGMPVDPENGGVQKEMSNSREVGQNSPVSIQQPVPVLLNDDAGESNSVYTNDAISPKMGRDSGQDQNVETEDTHNGAKEDSVSYSITTIERSARASVSSKKVPGKVEETHQEPNHSQSNARVLSSTNTNNKPKPPVKDEKDTSKRLVETRVKVTPPKPKSGSTGQKTADQNQPVEKSVAKVEKKKKVITKAMIMQAIAKTRKLKQTKAQFSIDYLHGKIKVADVYDKGYMIPQEELCPNNGRDLRVIIFVTTAPDHEHQRNAIRQTWGHFGMRKDVSIGFLVGRPDKSETQNIIDRENDRYGDIVQSNFIDVYANLTLKTVSMFEWLNTYCSEVRFVLKTDDDMYINVPLLLAFIYTKRNDQRSIYGRLARNWKPVRNKKSKYYISKETYSTLKYPEFLTGPAYLFTIDIAQDLFAKAMDSTLFKLEDVFITGLVAESLKIKRVGDSHFRNEKISLKDTCKLMQTISIHMVKYEEEFDIYKRTLDGKTKCRIK